MKENLKVETPNHGDSQKAHILFKDMGYLNVFDDEMYVYAICNPSSLQPRIISFDELRELAKPREYLNDKFELVVTNQPDDGWILVPDGAEYLTKSDDVKLFWQSDRFTCHRGGSTNWYRGIFTLDSYLKDCKPKILWQRKEKKVETEKKSRFLHQEWYEAFGRGEDVQFDAIIGVDWTTLTTVACLSAFDNPNIKFRLKPQTIQIGSRTIVKPISVKPEIGTEYFMPSLSSSCKYLYATWDDSNYDKEVLGRSLCHLTKEDAIAYCNALLELMK